MTEILEGIGVILPEVADNKCPICEGNEHDTTTDKKEGKGDLESKPANLGCKAIVQKPGLPNYTTAAHHLIPVNQCLRQFPRLCQMCDAVGYNANNKQNGMSLPTHGQRTQNVYDGVKYGSLSNEDKQDVAFVVMENLDLQWHVGHHAWKLDLKTDTFPHPENYDKLVKLKLRNLEKNMAGNGSNICKPQNGERGKGVIDEMNNHSSKIKEKVRTWKKYFVSAMSCRFAEKYRK